MKPCKIIAAEGRRFTGIDPLAHRVNYRLNSVIEAYTVPRGYPNDTDIFVGTIEEITPLVELRAREIYQQDLPVVVNLSSDGN